MLPKDRQGVSDFHPGRNEYSDGTILVLSGVRGDTRRYRTFHLFEQLQLAGVDASLAHVTDPDLPARFEHASLVIFHRLRWDGYVERLLENLRERGGLAIVDTDDLIFDPAAFVWINSPDFADPVRSALYQEDMRRNRRTLESCQAVTVSTDFLAEQVRRLGIPVWVHRNAFSLEMLALSETAYRHRMPAGDRVTVGYASGTPTHNRDFELIQPALQELLRRYPQVELLLIGDLDPGNSWGSLSGRIHRHKLVSWRQLPALLASFDINLAPLVSNNPFSQSKSEIKYVEAGLVRAPTVASRTEAFEYAICSGENGFLASSEEEWYLALAALVEEDDLRRRMGAAAYADCLARYHPQTRAAELVATLDAIYRQLYTRPLWPVLPEVTGREFRIDPTVERRPSSLQMGLYELRHRGLGTLLKRIWIFFRRLAAPIIPFRPNP